MIRIRWIDNDAADKAAGAVRSKRVEPRVRNACICRVGILGDKDASRRRRCPQGCCVGTRAPERCHVPTGTSRSTVICRGHCQPRCASWSDGNEVATRRIIARGKKLRTVFFEKRLVASPILRPPDAQRALEDCSRSGWIRIGNDGRVKLRTFAAGCDRPTRDDPLHWVAILEVNIVEI